MPDTTAAPIVEFVEELKGAPKPPTLRWWQLAAIVLLVVLCDLVIYRGEGFSGYAALFLAAPLLLCVATCRSRRSGDVLIVAGLLGLLAVRLAMCGWSLQIGLGFALLAAFAMTLSGLRPYVLETLAFTSQTVTAGYLGIDRQWQAVKQRQPAWARANWLAVGLPVGAFLAFGMLFILANPDLMATFGERAEWFFLNLRGWLVEFAPHPWEMLFWVAAFWIAIGAVRPVMRSQLLKEKQCDSAETVENGEESANTALYFPFRNMLVTVIALFAAYLAFEFKTLWLREFPQGFYYSGYAHEGAFWLTVALALTTLILSLVFRGRFLKDPQQSRLRRLVWIWSIENLLLVVAVYHRLSIYVGFNGMTRMRVVGLCGISAVIVGFLLVLYKIASRRDFVWLLRRQLWTLFFFIYLYAVMPVDLLVMRYNVKRIVDGDPAPSVQISVHPIDAEGLLQLVPLLKSDNSTIREGVQAMLAKEYAAVKYRVKQSKRSGWTAFQWSDTVLLERLADHFKNGQTVPDKASRQRALKRFHDYAYQWF